MLHQLVLLIIYFWVDFTASVHDTALDDSSLLLSAHSAHIKLFARRLKWPVLRDDEGLSGLRIRLQGA